MNTVGQGVKVRGDNGLTFATGGFGGSIVSIPLCSTLSCPFGNGVVTRRLEHRLLHFAHL